MHRMLLTPQSASLIVLAACGLAPVLSAAEPIPVGSRRELFVDRALVDRLDGKAEFRLHHPVPRDIAIVHDAPWEGNASAYHSVFHDGERYRMYYRAWGLSVADGRLAPTRENLCLALSDDGITWHKPDLRLHEFQGSKANNIVMTSAAAEALNVRIGGPAVFLDENPRVAPGARYKMVLTSIRPLGMRFFQSADGIQWTPISEGPTIQDGAFDAQNLAFWDSARGEYRAFWRTFTAGVTTADQWQPEGTRAIRTASSPDLVQWHHQADLAYGEAPETQLYENGVTPYYRAPHLLLGFPVRYIDRGILRHSTVAADGRDGLSAEQFEQWSESLRALPDLEQRMLRSSLFERFGSALTEALLMSSRDGVNFHRWDEAFVRPGIERTGTWNYGQHFLGWRMVETQSTLDDSIRELSFFSTEGYWTGRGTSVRRYTLRLDGFVSLHAPMRGGELITKPLIFTGNSLTLNFASSAAGGVRVALLAEAGEPIPGFGLEECDELFGDTLQRRVSWNGQGDVSSLSPLPVRLQFQLRDADVYSFQFQ
jgi:hypothetical protein